MRKEKIDLSAYRKRFDDLIAWNMPFEDNRMVVMDEARSIILEKKLSKYIKRLPAKPPVAFSWKPIYWGLGSLRVDIGVFKDAVMREDALQAWSTASKILDTLEKMKKLLETSREVKDYLGYK